MDQTKLQSFPNDPPASPIGGGASRFGLTSTINQQRRVQALREELLPAIEKTAQHLFAQVETVNFEQGVFELILPGRHERMSIRVSQIDPKTCLVNVLTISSGWGFLRSRARANIRLFFRTLKLFLPKAKIY